MKIIAKTLHHQNVCVLTKDATQTGCYLIKIDVDSEQSLISVGRNAKQVNVRG